MPGPQKQIRMSAGIVSKTNRIFGFQTKGYEKKTRPQVATVRSGASER
ncbi:MAG: hypothetical protein JWM99_2387 [Verrucomicrobiales bacterium]|nr:hypothetical protein [Verrucomicrobiales bacterium]